SLRPARDPVQLDSGRGVLDAERVNSVARHHDILRGRHAGTVASNSHDPVPAAGDTVVRNRDPLTTMRIEPLPLGDVVDDVAGDEDVFRPALWRVDEVGGGDSVGVDEGVLLQGVADDAPGHLAASDGDQHDSAVLEVRDLAIAYLHVLAPFQPDTVVAGLVDGDLVDRDSA